jgi:hypothetical protein
MSEGNDCNQEGMRRALPDAAWRVALEERRPAPVFQMLLGHASIQTTERYLGTKQDLIHAPNDGIRLRITTERCGLLGALYSLISVAISELPEGPADWMAYSPRE